jgi:hypothetical protein
MSQFDRFAHHEGEYMIKCAKGMSEIDKLDKAMRYPIHLQRLTGLMLPLLLFGLLAFAQAPAPPWRHFSLTGGPSLDAPSYVYDSNSNEMIVFGGASSSGGCFTQAGDTWYITNVNGIGGAPAWQPVTAAGTHPPARNRASAVYDDKNNRMIIFGGASCGGVAPMLQDVWVLENADGLSTDPPVPTWQPLTPPAPLPAGRAEHAAVYDSAANTMTIYGGCDDGIMDVPDDVWVLSNANGIGGSPAWTLLSPTGTPPPPRCGAVVTYSAPPKTTDSIMTVFGGCCTTLGDLWVLTGANGQSGIATWQQLTQSTTAPGPRDDTSAFGYDAGTNHDPGTNVMIFFGGSSYPGPRLYNGVWMLKDANDIGGTTSWANIIAGNLPQSPPPGNASGGYDPLSKRLIVLNDLADLWVLTTRNGIDFSGAKSLPTSAQLVAIARAGIQYAVGEISVRTSGNSAGVAELQTFQIPPFKTAAYSFLGLDKNAASGDQQVQAGITAMGGVGSATFDNVGFIAVDVEEESLLTGKIYNPAPLSTRLAIIAQALQAISNVGKKAVIYTNQIAWHKVTDDAICSQSGGQTTCGPGASGATQAYPLWEFTSYSRFRNDTGVIYCGDGVPSLTPFTSFDGWSLSLGKQFDIGTQASMCAGTRLYGAAVDFDVFDQSLFQ